MNTFTRSITRIIKGTANAFSRYPAAMFSALLMAVSASFRIQMAYTIERARFFNSLQLALLFGGFSGMLLAVLLIRKKGRSVFFWLVNAGGLLLTAGLFLLLRLQPGDIPPMTTVRVITASAISLLLFMLYISAKWSTANFNQAFFLTLKSALIAAIYALAILLGLFFVAFAVQSLVYTGLSSDVYSHIAAWSAFAWFAFFLGYFPSFAPDHDAKALDQAKTIPRFIEILFAYVLVFLMAALSLVLLTWAIQILIIREWPQFSQLSVIFSTYTLFGIWLALMTSSIDLASTRWYRRLFPYSAFLFLAFVSYALALQIRSHSLKTAEYFVAVIVIFAAASALILLVTPPVKNRLIAWVSIAVLVIMVLPLAGFEDLPVAMQLNRLQVTLERNAMLADGRIQAAAELPEQRDREKITDATEFILSFPDARQPQWFLDSLSGMHQFEPVFGFDPAYPDRDPIMEPDFKSIYLTLPQGTLPISDFQTAVLVPGSMYGYDPMEPYLLSGRTGSYEISLADERMAAEPRLIVALDEQVLSTVQLEPVFSALAEKYQDHGRYAESGVDFQDMILTVELEQATFVIVFQMIEIYQGPSVSPTYSFALHSIYLAEQDITAD